MTSSIEELIVVNDSGLLRMTLNRAQKANALNLAMNQTLAKVLQAARTDSNVHAVLLSGAGERVFSGGVDVREKSNLPEETHRQMRSTAFFSVLRELVDFPKPVVVAVNGAASGGGFMIAALADAIVATPTANFTLPEIDLGTPPLAGLVILSPIVGQALAYQLVQTGRTMGAEESLRHQLIQSIVAFSELNEKAQQCAQFLMAKNASAFAASKHWVRQSVKDQLLKAEQGMVDFRNIKGA